MHKAIQTRREGRRGCGWRKEGGMYLMSDGETVECGRLPIPCGTCPCCGRGIKQARGWTWVKGDEILRAAPECRLRGKPICASCVVHRLAEMDTGMMGLIWIGVRYYPTLGHFNREADKMGVSRRLSAIPRDFKLGETYVMLAHPLAIMKPLEMGQEVEYEPGIFKIFKPERIEIVVTGEEPDEVIDGYLERGLTPVKIEKIEDEQTPLDMTE